MLKEGIYLSVIEVKNLIVEKELTEHQFIKEYKDFYRISVEHNFYNELIPLFRKSSNIKHSRNAIMEGAKKFASRNEFRLNSNLYGSALKLGILDECCSHMLARRQSIPQKIYYTIFNALLGMVGVYNDKFTLKPLELDIFYAELNLAVEYDGCYHHDKNLTEKFFEVHRRDSEKDQKCLDKNILLVRIHEKRRRTYEQIVGDVKEQIITHLEKINKHCLVNYQATDVARIAVNLREMYDKTTLLNIKEIASNYSSIKDFIKHKSALYQKVRMLGRLDVFNHIRAFIYYTHPRWEYNYLRSS